MNSVEYLGALFVVAFFFNLLWEVWHAQLYTTCLNMKLPAFARLITQQALKDALWITIAFSLLPNIYTFAAALLMFAFVVEYHAIKTNRWVYAPSMPLIFGIGLSPLVELVVTGLAAVYALTFLGV